MFDRSIEDVPIGFVGLGTMGMPMAKSALSAGFSVVGFDVREEARKEFTAAGGETVDSLSTLAETCRVVSVVVQSDEQVDEVVAGDGGLFERFDDSGGIVLVHSTVHPETPETLTAACPPSVTLLDAPISGLRTRAESGDLAFMVGGDEAVLEYCRPLLESMGTTIHHLGPVGSGEVAKITNNLVALSNMMTTAEGVAVGTEWGIDRETLLDVMAESSADSFVLDNWEWLIEDWGSVQPGGFGGAADICRKDLQLALQLAESVNVEVPGAAVASQRVPAFFEQLTDE